MATRFVHKGPTAEGTGAAHGFSADDNGVLVHHNGTRAGVVNSMKVRAIAASTTLAAEDSGTLVMADSTTSVVIQLPPTRAGLRFGLTVKQLTTAGGHALSPNAADKIIGAGLTKADDADLVCSAATDRVGDLVWLVGDGIEGWYIEGMIGTWA